MITLGIIIIIIRSHFASSRACHHQAEDEDDHACRHQTTASIAQPTLHHTKPMAINWHSDKNIH